MSDRKSSSIDDPPNSRLFIVSSKQLTEEDFRKAFEPFGTIDEIWLVKDRVSGESKGITYIKYAKTSEAAMALEAMNGKNIGNLNRSIKVMIAASRDQGSRRETNEEEKIQRLFVVVPKNMTDGELYDYFKAFGDIDYANIIRDKETKNSRGYAYVKYFKFSHAAAAFEQCDRKYKPVFAEPRKRFKSDEKDMHNDKILAASYDHFTTKTSLPPPPIGFSGEEYTKLIVIASPNVNQDQLWKLFDVVPDMDYCQLKFDRENRPTRSVAEVVYRNPQWAAYAREKLHGFEYPPGYRLIVKPEKEEVTSRSMVDRNREQILRIAETIAKASSVLQAAGISPDILHSKLLAKDGVSCSVPLPEPKPLAGVDDETQARCFIVCSPNPPPNPALKDVFCRFGNLQDVYMLPNRNCGYAKYTSTESAENAIKILHGAEVMGSRLKVFTAEERRDSQRKRQRMEEAS